MTPDDRVITLPLTVQGATRATCFALLLSACAPGQVALIVDVRTDLVPGVEVAEIEVRIPEEDLSERVVLTDANIGTTSHRAAEWLLLDPDPERRLEVIARSPTGETVARRTALVDHRETLSLQIVLTRGCRSLVCDADTTCLGERCVDESCLSGEEPSCPPADCAGCAPLSACDRARCESGVCLHEADRGFCEAPLACVPPEGCVGEAPVDGGAPDAGMSDADAGDAGSGDAGVDAGRQDAGSTDGGALVDAGRASLCREGDGCDYLLQDCSGGRSCVPRREGTGLDEDPTCVPAGTGTDVACSSETDCAPGWDCLAGRCVELCCPTEGITTCTVSGAACVQLGGTPGGFCLFDECDIGTQAGCAAGAGCYEVSEGVFGCATSLGGADGSPCIAVNECAPGLTCNSISGTCAPYCHPTLPACPSGRGCQDFSNLDYSVCSP